MIHIYVYKYMYPGLTNRLLVHTHRGWRLYGSCIPTGEDGGSL